MKATALMVMVGLLAVGLPAVHADPPDGISAVVHDAVITSDEIELRTEATAESWRRQLADQPQQFAEQMAKARKEILDNRIEHQLILHDFKVAGYQMPDSVIDELVQERIRSRYGDRRTLTKSLQEQGTTYEKFRQQVKEQFIVEALKQKNISSEIIISPHKVETYYLAHRADFKMEDEVKIRVIQLGKSTDPNRPDAQKMAQEILAKLNEGASFEEMANAQPPDRDQPARHAGAEWFELSKLRKELADAAAKLKAGERSGVIDTPQACYLLMVEDTRPTHYKSLGEVREQIEHDLLSEERGRLEKQWIDKLKRKTFVRYF